MTENSLPVSVEVQEGIGVVTFADDVIAIIASLAATEIEGVAGMSGSMASGITEILGRKNLTKGVKVEVGKEQAAVDLTMIMNYGVQIQKVCRSVQENVKKAIETMSGLRVVEVNVHVVGVKIEKEAPAAASVVVQPAPQEEAPAPVQPRVK